MWASLFKGAFLLKYSLWSQDRRLIGRKTFIKHWRDARNWSKENEVMI
jgi:hypothetical protein